MTDSAKRVTTATRVVQAGTQEGSDSFRTSISIEIKINKNDFAPAVDRAVQRIVLERIESRFLDDTIIAEETDTTVPESELAWTVDPLMEQQATFAGFLYGRRVLASSKRANQPVA